MMCTHKYFIKGKEPGTWSWIYRNIGKGELVIVDPDSTSKDVSIHITFAYWDGLMDAN